MVKTVPAQKPGSSKQDYGTPWELIQAVEKWSGKLMWDLAASESNAKVPRYLTEKQDALSLDWDLVCGTEAFDHSMSVNKGRG